MPDAVLALLQGPQGALDLLLVQRQSRLGRVTEHCSLAGELGDQQLAVVAHQPGLDVLECA